MIAEKHKLFLSLLCFQELMPYLSALSVRYIQT